MIQKRRSLSHCKSSRLRDIGFIKLTTQLIMHMIQRCDLVREGFCYPQDAKRRNRTRLFPQGRVSLALLLGPFAHGLIGFGFHSSAYLKAYAHSSATSHDLWATLSAASGVDVAALMDSWITKVGSGRPSRSRRILADDDLRRPVTPWFTSRPRQTV